MQIKREQPFLRFYCPQIKWSKLDGILMTNIIFLIHFKNREFKNILYNRHAINLSYLNTNTGNWHLY